MHRYSLMLIASSPEILETDFVTSTLGRWPRGELPRIEKVTVDAVMNTPSLLDKAAISWIIGARQHDPHMEQLADVLLERHIPTLLTCEDDSSELDGPLLTGVTVVPSATSADIRCVLLRSMHNNATIIHEIKSEVSLLRRHQGGLCEQIGKIDEELRLAAQLQREFLPASMPSVGDVEFHIVFRPAGYVSGDIYDVFRLDESHIGFFLADAVGHGVPAALMTMFLKCSLMPKEIESTLPKKYRILEPNEALARLNSDMITQQSGSNYMTGTACYGVINCKTLELQFARAGHPYPIVFHADGSTQSLSPDGAMLGVFPDEIFELQKIQLSPGDRLIVYSDGIELAFPNLKHGHAEIPGEDATRYTEELLALGQGSLEEALDRMQERLDVESGSLHQRDDLTMLCMEISTPESRIIKSTGKVIRSMESELILQSLRG